jgi:hypothetical protein
MQSQLQSNPAGLPLEYAKRAGFSLYFLRKPDQRKLSAGGKAPIATAFLRTFHVQSGFENPKRRILGDHKPNVEWTSPATSRRRTLLGLAVQNPLIAFSTISMPVF